VATMPAGEDPDTLVRKGGAAALRPILDDGIDLLERKIQLLERKGWFEGVEHQREALDRLLPTIRAAADPITRDLYLKAVSERTGVSREVLREQAAARPSSPTVTPPPPNSPLPAGVKTVRAPVRRRAEELGAERDLLRVLMKEPAWLARAATEVPAEWFETSALREVYEALRLSPENVGSGIFLEQLSADARRAWAWLNGWEAKYGAPEPDVTYVAACRALEARPLRRQLAALARKKSEGALTSEEYETLVSERQRLTKEISSRYPEELLKRKLRRGDVDAR
jgi:primase-like protein